MENIIETLKKEHLEIQDILQKVQSSSATSKENLKLIYEFSGKLMEHIKKEDEYVYPELERLAKDDVGLRVTLDMFKDEMEQISEALHGFLSKYPDASSIDNNKDDFVKDLSRMIILLKNRIMKEEIIIFKQFQRAIDKKSTNTP